MLFQQVICEDYKHDWSHGTTLRCSTEYTGLRW